jgi:3-methylfumaryl-CoA hydratase
MTDHAFDLPLLQQWVGRTEVKDDLIQPAMAAALAATLDREAPAAELPPLWHWIYFWTVAPASEVGADGHPQRGGFLPPVPLPRRMWAGGRLTFTAPLAIGQAATRTSRILDVEAKAGASGQLAFVTVRHEIAQNGRIAVTEEHDIVYRDLPQPGAAAPAGKAAPEEAAWSREIVPDPVLLFRYSALTFNGHRIHYDRSYVTGVEGYPGLIVHGPLIATLLVDLLHRERPDARLRAFAFRAVRPTFAGNAFAVCAQPGQNGEVALWAKDHEGYLTMQATATLA